MEPEVSLPYLQKTLDPILNHLNPVHTLKFCFL
jgi:hypothetical protein